MAQAENSGATHQAALGRLPFTPRAFVAHTPTAVQPPQAQVFIPAVGWGRPYLSQRDAQAYEAGWHAYPAGDPGAIQTPRWYGWRDRQAEAVAALRDEAAR